MSAKPPTLARSLVVHLLPLTTTEGMASFVCANAGTANAWATAQARRVCCKTGFIVCSDSSGARAPLLEKPEPTWGKGKQMGNCVALSFAGIIQIRYEGYLSPGTRIPGPLAKARV